MLSQSRALASDSQTPGAVLVDPRGLLTLAFYFLLASITLEVPLAVVQLDDKHRALTSIDGYKLCQRHGSSSGAHDTASSTADSRHRSINFGVTCPTA